MGINSFMPHLFQNKFLENSDFFSEYLLKTMAFEKVPLVFLFDSHIRLTYSSMVLHADRKENKLILDALQPTIGNNHLISGSHVTFSGKAKGVEAGFRAQVREGKPLNDQKTVTLFFPHESFYAQKRDSLRVVLPAKTPPIHLSRPNGGHELVQLINIGSGGMRVLFSAKNKRGEPNRLFKEGDTVIVKNISFEGFHLPPLTGKVVYLQYSGRDTGKEMMAMGIGFLDFPKDFEEPLISYIMKMDRENLKNVRIDPRG